MRAHLARRVLAEGATAVDILTTSDAGRSFLAALGSPARVLPSRYRLLYDGRHNLRAEESARLLRRYLVSPRGLVRDVATMRRWSEDYDLVVDDSFHPSLVLGSLDPRWRRRIVHVRGDNLQGAVAQTLRDDVPWGGRALAAAFELACAGAGATVEHTLRPADTPRARAVVRLPPLIASPTRCAAEVRAELGAHDRPLAAVYLNPHFDDRRLAAAIVDALADRGFVVHAVAEGLAPRAPWRAYDPRLTDVIAAADVLVAGPGMGALAHVAAYGVPMLALASRQPEQQRNLATLRSLPVASAVVDLGAPRSAVRLREALSALADAPRGSAHPALSPARVHRAWRLTFEALADLAGAPAVRPFPTLTQEPLHV